MNAHGRTDLPTLRSAKNKFLRDKFKHYVTNKQTPLPISLERAKQPGPAVQEYLHKLSRCIRFPADRTRPDLAFPASVVNPTKAQVELGNRSAGYAHNSADLCLHLGVLNKAGGAARMLGYPCVSAEAEAAAGIRVAVREEELGGTAGGVGDGGGRGGGRRGRGRGGEEG